MGTLWLRAIDPISRLIPAPLIPQARNLSDFPVCLVRPGGLGDLVLLTRACFESGIEPRSLFWILESRNAIWADYLGLTYIRYDSVSDLYSCLSGKWGFHLVINSEQTFGLASIFSKRLTHSGGNLVGFLSNLRTDLFNMTVSHNLDSEHELTAFKRLISVIPQESRNLHDTRVPQSLVRKGEHCVIAIAGRTARYKKLSIREWCALITRAKRYSSEVILVGSPMDIAFARQIVSCSNNTVKNLVGIVSFEEVVESIQTARRLLGVDSGLVHIADFFGIPSDVVFTESSPTRWGPLVAESFVLHRSQLGADGGTND